MKTTVFGALAMLVLTAGTCRAQGFLEGTPLDNTPFDARTWVPESRDQGSHLPVETSPARGMTHRWEYRDGYFRFQGNGRWIEVRRNGPPSYFREISRNNQVVEMYDSNRKMAVLLTPTRGMFRRTTAEQWRAWGSGNYR